MTADTADKIRAFVLATEEQQDRMRACAALAVGKPGLRQPTFVVPLLRSLEAEGLIYFARGGYYRTPQGKLAASTYTETARAVMREGARQ